MKSEWYHLGKWIEPALAAEVWLEYASVAQQFFKKKLDGKILYLNGDFFLSQHDVDIISTESYLAAKNHNQKFFDKILSVVNVTCIEISNASKNITSPINFLEQYKQLTGVWMPLNIVALGVEKAVNEIDKEAFHHVKGYIDKKPLTLQEIDDLRSLKKNFRKIPKNVSSIPKKALPLLKMHIKKYPWIGTHHFNIGEFTLEKMLARMKDDHEESSSSDGNKESYAVKLLNLMGFVRFRCAETSGIASFYLKSHLEKIARKKGLTYEDIVEHTIAEIKSLSISKNTAIARKKQTGLFYDRKEHILSQNEFLKYYKELLTGSKEESFMVKGLIACKGHAKGIVKKVSCQKEMSGFEKGMILVAHETTPDIVIAMERAAAIVTDFGGLTSHAAIVARELKKPCIVGTKFATKMLKDGDLVEVDANKGIVKIIKNN